MQHKRTGFSWAGAALVCVGLAFVTGNAAAVAAEPAQAKVVITSVDRTYKDYKPDFLGWAPIPSEAYRKTSSEKTFHSKSFNDETARVYALIDAGKENEGKGLYATALEIYQQVVERYPETLYRISPYGIYLPASRYCQLRILGFPKEQINHYRSKYDAAAREAFAMAEKKYSLEGLARIGDFMLCTTYGPQAMLTLGDAALDRGHYLTALEYYRTVRESFPAEDHASVTIPLKIAYCNSLLGQGDTNALARILKTTPLKTDVEKRLALIVSKAKPADNGTFAQHFSPHCLTLDDYARMPPTSDPLALKTPNWTAPVLAGGMSVDTQPVVTDRSVIYRDRNVIVCRSLLNGEVRWQNDSAGQVNWRPFYRHRREDILVHEGQVFTPMHKFGPSLVALDETTGQIKWSYGPMSASTEEEANMNFRTAPAGGPAAVFAGYVLDNIKGGVHIDSEYGIMAFDSVTGSVKWRRPICWLNPGKFVHRAGGIRNRIRSFSTPPIYHQGTVYYCSNAGSIAALDALSGQIKWLMKYPYYVHPDDIHDASRGFGGNQNHMHPPSPMLWLNQPPLLIEDDLYVLPVNSPLMFKIDRRTGKTHWSRQRLERVHRLKHASGCGCGVGGSTAYFMGPLEGGKLLFVYSMRGEKGGIFILDARTGNEVWASGDPVATHTKHPSLYLGDSFQIGHDRDFTPNVNNMQFQVTARPFLSSDGKLLVSSAGHACWPIYGMMSNLAVLDLNKREFTERRYFIDSKILNACDSMIKRAPMYLGEIEKQPAHAQKDPAIKRQADLLKKLAADTLFVNEHPYFTPFARMTFDRYGDLFELRVGPSQMSMVYNRPTVEQTIGAATTPSTLFARAELAAGERRLDDAAALMRECLASIPPEDTAFRTMVNQLMFRVCRDQARRSVRAGNTEEELDRIIAMSRSATTLEDEILTLFATASAHARRKNALQSSEFLRALVSTYGELEYRIPSSFYADRDAAAATLKDITRRTALRVKGNRYDNLISAAAEQSPTVLALHYSALSPAPRDLTMPAGDVAIRELLALRNQDPQFVNTFNKQAATMLEKASEREQIKRLMEFPGTAVGQTVFSNLLVNTFESVGSARTPDAATVSRKRLFQLAHIGRLCAFEPPATMAARLAPPLRPRPVSLAMSMRDRELNFEEERSPAWLVLERRGTPALNPNLMFLGARVKTRVDHKFLLYALDMETGKTVWKATEQRVGQWFDEIRLKDQGEEPGFFEAFVLDGQVIVHGLYDVLAFGIDDGKLRWRYQTPTGFEIEHALTSGNILFLCGPTETVALYAKTEDPRGEVLWQNKELGSNYIAPYVVGERLVLLRTMPSSLTIRDRGTGRLVGRLTLPDLRTDAEHPLLETGPAGPPAAWDKNRVVVCSYSHYLMLDVETLKIVWKRPIDVTTDTPLRLTLNGDYLAIIKRNYDVKAIYMLSSKTGAVLWQTDPKDSKTPQPIYSMLIRDGKLYGIKDHPGQGFYLVGLDAATGKPLFPTVEQKGYGGKPVVRLNNAVYGNILVTRIQDRQDFQIKLFDIAKGSLLHTVKVKGVGEFGSHGRASAAVLPRGVALMGKYDLRMSVSKP
jgi:outer membrane protein assembly factor BamB/tetratricopeptide (TPR) repeat protein